MCMCVFLSVIIREQSIKIKVQELNHLVMAMYFLFSVSVLFSFFCRNLTFFFSSENQDTGRTTTTR